MILSSLAKIVSYFPWFGLKKPRPSIESLQPAPVTHVDEGNVQHPLRNGGILSALARIILVFPWFRHKVSRPSTEPLQASALSSHPLIDDELPSPISPPLSPLSPILQSPSYIADAFQDYIRNRIPVRFIDTSSFKFVERDAIYDMFSSEIAQITHEDIYRRVPTDKALTHPEAAIYFPAYRTALQETIRDVVRYAIFSHRWTGCEPSFKDVSSAVISSSAGKWRGARSAGIDKLIHVCDTARKLGYKLVWSDTCCIDRANTAELSEAIHAMFRWYAYAHVCIVHLGASSLSDFERDPWLKRGWTLQELLAPRRIKFYDKDWRSFTDLLNDKDNQALMSTLSIVTGIPEGVLMADNTCGIKGRGAWEIMSWAAPRKTTRIEDRAYSLFGLFDISIPIAYGEGEKAFPRLVEAIVARHPTAWDVFVWAGQASEWHPALPYSPACYPRWDKAVVSGDVGMTSFTLMPHGLRLTSVPPIPMTFLSAAKRARDREGSWVVTLRSNASAALGVYGDVTVECGSGRLRHMQNADDLRVCILNYKPVQSRRGCRGRLRVGQTYVCFLLHMKVKGGADGSTWLKFATDNVLRIVCVGQAERTNVERASVVEDGLFDLPLKATCIRAPRAHPTASGMLCAPFH